MFFKLLTVVVMMILLWQMTSLWLIGRQLARQCNDHLLSRHRGLVACIGCLTVLAVVLVEAQVRLSPAPTESPLLLAFHLTFDGLLVLVFAAIVMRFTGLRDPVWHKRLAYSFFIVYAAVIGTGTMLLYRLPA